NLGGHRAAVAFLYLLKPTVNKEGLPKRFVPTTNYFFRSKYAGAHNNATSRPMVCTSAGISAKPCAAPTALYSTMPAASPTPRPAGEIGSPFARVNVGAT